MSHTDHSWRHVPRDVGGTDPMGPWDSTENVGDAYGVRSDGASDGDVLTSNGAGGSLWTPAAAGAVEPFYDAVSTLNATRNLLGYWRLGDGASPFADTGGHASGPNDLVKTSTGTAMTDSVTGALPAADDDGAVEFNAVSGVSGDYLSATDSIFEGNASARSVVFWARPAGSYTGAQYMVGTRDASNGGWHVGMNGSARALIFLRIDTGGSATATGPSLPNADVLVGINFDPSTGVKMYLDGVPVYNDNVVQGIYSSTTMYIGRKGGGTPSSYQGAVDELSLWGDRLTDDEHAYLAAAGGLAQDEGVRNIVAVTGAYTAGYNEIVLATGTVTITLPTALDKIGKAITVKNVGVGTVTVARTSSQTIDGAAANGSLTVSKSAREYTSDGTGWQITAAYL